MSNRSGVALINLTEIMNSGWRRLAHWCFVKKRVLTTRRIDQNAGNNFDEIKR